MNKIKLLLVFILLLGLTAAFAQTAAVGFKDATQGTLNLVRLQNPTYPYPTLTTYAKWWVQLYKSTDNVIDPLGSDGLPTGDDIVALPSAPADGHLLLAFGPTGALALSNFVFYPAGGLGNTWQGDKVYLRIFNAPTIGEATAYIQFNGLYTVPTANSSPSILVAPINNWNTSQGVGGWVTYAGPTGYSLSVDSNYLGADIYKDGIDTGFDTPHLFEAPAEAGLYTVVMPNVAWTPASFNFTAEADATIRFIGVKTPGPAQAVFPGLDQILYIAHDAVASSYTLQWAPPAAGPVPDGYHVWWMGAFQADVMAAGPLEWATPAIAEGAYNWRIIPFIADPVKGNTRNLSPVKQVNINSPKGDAVDAIDWYFSIVRNEPPLPMLEPGVPEEIAAPAGAAVPGVVAMIGIDSFFDVYYDVELYSDLTPPPPNPECNNTNTYGLDLWNPTQVGFVDLYINPGPEALPGDLLWIKYFWMGMWYEGIPYPATAPGGAMLPNVPIGAEPVQIVIYYGPSDPDLPVELSSFTAVFDASYFVDLTWVVQSETNHLGYYILRNNAQDMSTATVMNSVPVSNGSANGTQITYNFRDEEIQSNQTYYYWLESVDLDGSSQFFGPIGVVITGENPEIPTPEVPINTALLDAYPNPFTSQSSLPYYLKTAGDVKIEIYNSKGSLIRTFTSASKAAGYHKIAWDGRDLNGRPVSSGIYFYRMTSGKYTASKKIVLVK